MKNKNKTLDVDGALLDRAQLESYMKKIASDHILTAKSDKKTFPVPRVKENLKFIFDVYTILNEDIKNNLPIHPAGEWLLDNFYIVEKNAKTIIKDMTLKKYTNLLGIANGINKGYARAFVIAKEIISYTDGKIDGESIEGFLKAYQSKKTLSMDELWNIVTFLQIALIEKIRSVCEKIYLSQMQKRKVEGIVLRLVEFKQDYPFKNNKKIKIEDTSDSKYPFIEYMSYRLKKHGKNGYGYMEILEEQVNKMGSNILECINREHYDIASKKISIGNSINSINMLSRLNYVKIFDNINGVEDVLKKDPANIYEKMDYKTKEYYRNSIETISKCTKISELYIAKKCVELASNNNENIKKNHVGYYLIGKGRNTLVSKILNKKEKKKGKCKPLFFVVGCTTLSIIVSTILAWHTNVKTDNFLLSFIAFLFMIILIKNIFEKINQYISGKILKPKLIPKMDFSGGIPKEHTTMVVIPTIVKSASKVKEIFKKLEVYYVANKSENLYFTLLGDCSSEDKELMDFDDEVINAGIEQCNILNKKYTKMGFPKFNFVYRKRLWNSGEKCYLGWERKRGLLHQFNEFILGNEKNIFRYNTLENMELPDIRYIITLDSDTNLTLNTGLELIGAMAHPLNIPEIDKKNNVVVDGYAIIQPRVGIGLSQASKSVFSKLFSGIAGTDSYTNAVSDFYEDNYEEGIYTGKGIYDVNVFSKVLKNEIPENKVLSHDLLEGCYLKCGLASDIVLMDGFPSTYDSFKKRAHRWIRGDYQILSWIWNKKINVLSKFKIIDNIYRSWQELSILVLIIIYYCTRCNLLLAIAIISTIFPYILEIINKIVSKKNGQIIQKKYHKEISGYSAIFARAVMDIGLIPDKAYMSLNACCKAIYRLCISKKHLLEWTTSEDAETVAKSGVKYYYGNMFFNVFWGILSIIIGISLNIVWALVFGVLWIIFPAIINSISKPIVSKKPYNMLDDDEKKYVYDIGKKTWQYFKDNLNEKTNYLPPDNYQEDRKEQIVYRTSPTNIGLALISVISSYDLGYESKNYAFDLIEKMLNTIIKLPRWYGHLYNWYNISTLEPLFPRYVSSVDSGNFIGYLYVLKQFFIEADEDFERKKKLINIVDKIIDETDFSKLFDVKTGLFSIGYNLEDDKMTDSYYDLLASEARQTSLVAIAKKDVSPKHWKNLSRALTTLNKYKGLISWSGTAFEYLMPSINIKRYPGSLLDESCKFMIMSQIEYAKKLGTTWGISEAAFNLKDFSGNYQYKAFGIPWLGLKRGLADDVVVSSYGTILAISDVPREVVSNLRKLEESGMYSRYGFYESIDYTPSRARNKNKFSIVKTYMAHHQGLILLSINNLVNDNILQRRFSSNPEIEGVDILLQERMPDNVIITKEKKEHIEKIKYLNYDYYSERVFDKMSSVDEKYNLISNNKYSILIDGNGNGYSKYNGYLINRFKLTDDVDEGIHFCIKDKSNGSIWSATKRNTREFKNDSKVIFFPDKSEFLMEHEEIKSAFDVFIAPDDAVEIRKLNVKNVGEKSNEFDIYSYFEPALSSQVQDSSHKAFNKLFLSYEIVDNILIIRRRARSKNEQDIYMATAFISKNSSYNGFDFEIDKQSFWGRNSLGIPDAIKFSKQLRNRCEYTTNPIVAFKKSVILDSNCDENFALIIGVSHDKNRATQYVKKYSTFDSIARAEKLSKAQTEAKIQYLGSSGKEVNLYERMLSCLVSRCGNIVENNSNNAYTSELWKFGVSGDNPIMLVEIKNISEIDIVKKLVKALEFYKLQNFDIDLVILNNEPESYENYLQDAINEVVWNYAEANNYRKIFIFKNLSFEDKELFRCRANIVVNGKYGKIDFLLDELEHENSKVLFFENKETKSEEYFKDVCCNLEKQKNPFEIDENMTNLKFYNEYGGFSKDGKEYVINVNKNKKLPVAWSNILANEKFGTVVTESMGGYTWYKNSRLNRITAWNNDPISDVPSEVIYFYDAENKKYWTTFLGLPEDDGEHYIKFGLGYAKYMHYFNSIEQCIDVFVPQDESVKINVITLKNLLPQKRKIKIIFYLKLVLDEDEFKSSNFIYYDFNKPMNCIFVNNKINNQFVYNTFISSSEKICGYTGCKKSFFGVGGISKPDGIGCDIFETESKYCDGIIALSLDVEIEAMENKKISLFFGCDESKDECKKIIDKYQSINNCEISYEKNKKYWNNITGKIIVNTPEDSINLTTNGWMIYQAYCSRMLAKTGFYQSGGAWGYRDQLQDAMCMKYVDLSITKNQIIKHSAHQFIEGDVLHWWHEETMRGVRTRFSDDLLWLVYVVCDYISFSGDYDILDIETPYLEGNLLEDGVDEKYDFYAESGVAEPIYNHCIRAIDKSLDFGSMGIPKIGSGDWNDGFNFIGNKGNGQSVWLAFFLYDILKKFVKLCEYKSDETHKNKYECISENLKKCINQNCWDGRWYNRAFCDDGSVIGSIKNQECKIDGISQSWAVISGVADDERKKCSMESLEHYLVDKQNGLIKLLNPPFEKGSINPGYIMSYLPGTRENGGQYTHGAIWAIIAEAMIGNCEKAVEHYKMINPIEHSKTRALADKYKVEPYVISADIYSEGNLAGQGGWSWYTGSASWYYICIIKYILGINIENGVLNIHPHIPYYWTEYSIIYKYGKSVYNIKIKNLSKENLGVKKITLDGYTVEDKKVKLIDDGKVYNIEAIL